jgi:hypothetical protein
MLHLSQVNLTVHQKGVYYAGIKMFNRLPMEIKSTYKNEKTNKLWGLACERTVPTERPPLVDEI